MGALSDAKPLLAIAAGELHLHPAVLALVILAAAALISRRIIPSIDFLVVRRPAAGEPRLLVHLHPAGTAEAAAAPAGSAPRSVLAHFVVLCVAMATVLHAEPLVHAAAELRLGPAAAVCGGLAAAALFNWVIVSINHLVALRPAEREPKTLPPPPLHLRRADPAAASTARPSSSSLARPAFAVLAALTSASWFVEPFAAAAALRLPGVVVIIAVLFFAALFNLSVHGFRSFFLTRRPPVAAARWEWEGAGAIAVAVMIAGVAACLVAAAGSAYVYAPARS